MEVETNVADNCTNLNQKKKHRTEKHKLLVTEVFVDFSKNTTLHGLRYVTEIGLSLVEKYTIGSSDTIATSYFCTIRSVDLDLSSKEHFKELAKPALGKIFWILMFMISLVLCFILIERVWYKWWNSPVIVSFNERMIPVREVPFPAITICPQMKNKLSEHEYQKQYYKYQYHSRISRETGLSYASIKDELKLLDDAILVCRNKDDYPYHIINHNLTDESSVHNIEKIAPTIKNTFLPHSEWRELFIWSEKLFNKVITSEGICFTFNTAKHTDMFKKESIQNKYFYLHPTPEKTEKDDYSYTFNSYDFSEETGYPRQGRENGAYPDLPVILRQNDSDNDGLCNSLYRGYKIYLHHPDDMPQSSLHYYPLLPGQVTSLAVKFNAISTSESLMNYAPEMRQCYSPKDRELRYFKKYTPSNCRLECISIYTYKRCGCVWFHMPHSNSSEICTPMRRLCVDRAQYELASNKLKLGMENVCNCLPSCDSIQYDADVFKTTFDLNKYISAFYQHDPSRKYDISYSKLEVYFKEAQFVAMRRSELFGLTDFLANCGGLLGLFLGFSFLSIVEIFYFCTLRLWYALKKGDKVSIKNKKKRHTAIEN